MRSPSGSPLAMTSTKPFFAACLALSIAGCGADPEPQPTGSESEPAPAPSAAATPLTGESRFPQSFRVLGTEPFWAIHVSEGKLRYMTPEDQEGRQIEIQREQTERDELALSGTLEGEALTLSVTEEPCSDGMSDRSYPFAATLRLGKATLRGCARPTEP